MSAITVLDKNNAPNGPLSREQVAEKLQSGEFSLESMAFVEGMTQWAPLREVLGRIDPAPAVPSLPPAAPLATAPGYSYAATMEPPKHLEYAGFWIRAAAHLLDNLFVSIPFMTIWILLVFAFVGVSAFAPLMKSDSQMSNAAAMALIGVLLGVYVSFIVGRVVVTWLYHAILESGNHQATWGKRIVGLRVTSINGNRISFKHATGRYFSSYITNMTMGIGYLMVAFTDRKQALHDMIASTLVVKNQG